MLLLAEVWGDPTVGESHQGWGKTQKQGQEGLLRHQEERYKHGFKKCYGRGPLPLPLSLLLTANPTPLPKKMLRPELHRVLLEIPLAKDSGIQASGEAKTHSWSRCSEPSATTDPFAGISSPPLGYARRLGPRDGRGSWMGRDRCPKLSLFKSGQWWRPLGSRQCYVANFLLLFFTGRPGRGRRATV